MELSEREHMIAERLLKEIRARLRFLMDVGLDYLSLGRAAGTLAGGEAQRIRLATQIGSGLVGVLYILDEPSIGLHQRDNRRLIDTLLRLRDLGNTLIVVEHDEATIMEADHIVDIGPLAGELGGEIVYSGDLKGLLEEERSITGAYLSGRRQIPTPQVRRRRRQARGSGSRASREHNLQNIDGRHPARAVRLRHRASAAAGKSTLVQDVLLRALMQKLYRSRLLPGKLKRMTGWEQIDKVIDIDQSPIGRTPRSNPATYTGVFDHIRKLFAQVPEARIRGYQPGRFSFNVRGGRCENCAGDGQIKIEMHFLPDVYVTCEVCKGRRYNRETLEVKYKGRSIADVLEMSVEEALEFFQNIPPIHRHMQTLSDVGLGYIKLGQPAPTLSGGEAQRIKLSSELHKRATGNTIYVLDEPTTGLHFEDIRKLLGVLQRLVATGQHRAGHRAQPRRGQDGRLDHRPRARGRRHGRAAGRGRHARGDRRVPRLAHGPVPRRGPRPSGGRRRRRGCIAACAPRLTMLARIPADVSKRLLILTCAAALLAGACSNLPEADVNFGSGKEFVPYVADHLDDAGLGNAVALDKDGVPYVSYFIFTAKPVPGAIPIPRPLGAPFITTGGDKPKDGAAVGVASVSSDGIWTRGAAAQVDRQSDRHHRPVRPRHGRRPGRRHAGQHERHRHRDRRERRQARRLGGPGRHLVRDRHRIVQGKRRRRSKPGSRRSPIRGPLGRPSVTVNDSGQPLVAYAIDAPNGQDIRVATTNGTKWTTQTAATIAPCFGCRRSGPAPIAVDAGGPLVVYVDGAAGAVMAARLTGATWTTETVETGHHAVRPVGRGGRERNAVGHLLHRRRSREPRHDLGFGVDHLQGGRRGSR